MEFRDLKRQYQVLKKDMDQAILETVSSGAYIMGAPVRELERQLAAYVGVRHCLTCANGTDALTLALKTWGVGPGDAVFVPDFTFFSSAEVVALEGATPVFVDVREDTFNLDPADLERAVQAILREGKLTPRVIIAVDLFGLPANYPEIRTVADRYGLYILEDGAQGFGGTFRGKRACGFGDISTTSFFPAKPVGCYGDGGAVFTDHDEWAALIDSYRVHGKGAFKYDNVRIGLNSRLDTVQAAILQVKLKAFEAYELEAVNLAAAQYTALLKDVVATPSLPEGFGSSWAQYTLRLKDKTQRDSLQAALKADGVPSMIYYPKPMHLQTAFASCHSEQSEESLCPVATSLCDRVLSLPMHPYLTEEQIRSVAKAVRNHLS
ncbi:MAG: DegT/DnrJ/EryC1/StrS family aminotransferase [Bacteroidales bacterium]|nr:DegT/DnrJ/EryC1/StrS family aminotransferase [Bacteroidales bacterium]